MSLLRALRFEPVQLAAVAAQVPALHPNTARRMRAIEGTRLDELVQRLRECEDDPEVLRLFGRDLTAREHRGLVGVLARQNQELSARIHAALKDNLQPHSVAPLWRTWQNVPLDRTALSLLRRAATDFGMSAATAPAWEVAADQWVTGKPLPEIVQWAGKEGLRMNDLPLLADSPFASDTPLMDHLWGHMLMYGSPSQLLAEDPDEIHTRGFALGPADVQQFGRNYLTRLPPPRWRVKVLEELQKRYGLPDAERSRPAFWAPLAEEPKAAFRRWFLKRVLKQAFGRGSERHRFWETWVDEMRDVSVGWAGTTEYAIIDFPNFGVVEFFEVGHAAYFYDRNTVNEIRRVRPSNAGDLKTGSDRLIHREGWQSEADTRVRKRLRRR